MISLSSEAQIRIVGRGYTTVDSAVLVPPTIYRKIRQKVYFADTAIYKLEKQISLQQETINLQSMEIDNLVKQNALRDAFVVKVRDDLATIKDTVIEIQRTPDEKLPFYKTDAFLGGVIVVVVLSLFF